MGYLVALLAIIFWLAERSKLKKQGNDMYRRGFYDGYEEFRIRAKGLLSHENELRLFLDTKTKIIDNEAPPVETNNLGQIIDSRSNESNKDEALCETTNAPEMAQPSIPVQLTPEQTEAEKVRRTVRNLNLLLYVGSFLIVAGMGVFVTLTMPTTIKLICLILMVVVFYIAGLVLYVKSPRLRPAAVAFTGTGLTVLPFIGFALDFLGGMPASMAWFITSLVGLVAYAVAAMRLNSQLVSYITIAFVISTALSAVSPFSSSVVWYFIVVIGLSTVANSLHYLWPNVLPRLFSQPVEQVGLIATPVALLASLLTYSNMNITLYEVLFAIATAHYIAVWLERRWIWYEVAVRALGHMTLLIVAFDYIPKDTNKSETILNVVWVGLLVLQAIYSFVRVTLGNRISRWIETWFVGVSIGLIVCSLTIWLVVDDSAWWIAGTLGVVSVISAVAMKRFRQVWWGYVVAAVSTILPFVIMRWAVQPAISYTVIALVFVAFWMITTAFLLRIDKDERTGEYGILLQIASYGYVALLLLSAHLTSTTFATTWSTLFTVMALVIMSYVVRQVLLEGVATLFLLLSAIACVQYLRVYSDWQITVIAIATSLVLVLGGYIHHMRHEIIRRDILVTAGAVALLGLVFNVHTYATLVTSVIVLLAAAVVMMAFRIMRSSRSDVLSIVTLSSYVIYPVAAIIVALTAGAGWPALAMAVFAALLWMSSYIEKRATGVLAVSNVLLLLALNSLWMWRDLAPSWQFAATLWIAAGVYYLTYWFAWWRGDELRRRISLVSVLIVLLLVSVLYFFSSENQWVIVSAASLFSAAAVMAGEGYLTRVRVVTEIAIYIATLAAQRFVSVIVPDLNVVLYGHWWAATIGLVAWWRGDTSVRWKVALGFITFPTMAYALAGNSIYSLLFLVEHVGVVTVGAVLRKQWALWWGIISVIVAVVYFIRSYTTLILLLLGLLLIVFVIWRLLRIGKR